MTSQSDAGFAPADETFQGRFAAWRKRRDERDREEERGRLSRRAARADDGPASLGEAPALSRGTGLTVNSDGSGRTLPGGPLTVSGTEEGDRHSSDPGASHAGKKGRPGGREEAPEGRGPLVLTEGTPPASEVVTDDAAKGDSAPAAFFVKGGARRYEKAVRPGAFYADDERVAEYDGGGFVQDNYPVPRSVYARLVAVLADALGEAPNADAVRLVAHVWIVGALRHAEADAFCPIPWQVLARDVPEADTEALLLCGVLDMAPHTYAREGTGRCREWAVSDDVADALDAALATAGAGEPYVNLFTGRARRGRRPGNRRHDDNRNPYPKPVTDAMDAVPFGIVNLPSLRAHLDRLETAADEAEGDDRPGARARWRNDALCVAWIESRGLKKTDVPGVYTYPHAWDMQKAGRIQPRKSGGAQSLSRAGKVACYDGIADVQNYDLRSSQPRILKAELDALGIGCEWLDAYLANPDAKHEHAAGVGCGVDEWKGAFMAAVTGGSSGVPKTFEVKAVTRFVGGLETTTYKPVCEAMKALEKAMGREEAREAWPRLRGELDALLRAVGQWHRYLKTWANKNATDGRGGRFVTNAVGARLNLSDLSARELPRKVAAHVLQGREAMFVHSLCTLGDGHGFRVVSHEHDGIVTLGEVPDAAIQQAQDMAAMPYAQMVPKPFI